MAWEELKCLKQLPSWSTRMVFGTAPNLTVISKCCHHLSKKKTKLSMLLHLLFYQMLLDNHNMFRVYFTLPFSSTWFPFLMQLAILRLLQTKLLSWRQMWFKTWARRSTTIRNPTSYPKPTEIMALKRHTHIYRSRLRIDPCIKAINNGQWMWNIVRYSILRKSTNFLHFVKLQAFFRVFHQFLLFEPIF